MSFKLLWRSPGKSCIHPENISTAFWPQFCSSTEHLKSRSAIFILPLYYSTYNKILPIKRSEVISLVPCSSRLNNIIHLSWPIKWGLVMIGGQHTSMFGSLLHTDWTLPKSYHSPSCLQETVMLFIALFGKIFFF